MTRLYQTTNLPRAQEGYFVSPRANERTSRGSQGRVNDLENEHVDSTQDSTLKDCALVLFGVASGILIYKHSDDIADGINKAMGSLNGRVSLPSMAEIKGAVQKALNSFQSLFQGASIGYQGSSYQGI